LIYRFVVVDVVDVEIVANNSVANFAFVFVIAYDAPPTIVVVDADSAHIVVADDNVVFHI
jgi:hypothetical protein